MRAGDQEVIFLRDLWSSRRDLARPSELSARAGEGSGALAETLRDCGHAEQGHGAQYSMQNGPSKWAAITAEEQERL